MQGEKTIVTFQAPVELREKLVALAVEHDRSLSAEVRRACDVFLRLNAKDDESPA